MAGSEARTRCYVLNIVPRRLVVPGVGRNFNVPMATAARTVICEVEEIVPLGALDPHAVVTPGVYVDYLVRCGAVKIPWRGF
jgi:3-oxoadipate CoA-transferase, alpha subunit